MHVKSFFRKSNKFLKYYLDQILGPESLVTRKYYMCISGSL
jgi:hypothetical protein